MTQRSATEISTRWATTVDTVQDAFTFIMEHLDNLSGPPTIHVNPVWRVSNDPSEEGQFFEVVITDFKEVSR